MLTLKLTNQPSSPPINCLHTIPERIVQNQFEVIQQQNDPQLAAQTVGLPAGLMRRYEVSIIPALHEKARKIREIKAAGIEP